MKTRRLLLRKPTRLRWRSCNRHRTFRGKYSRHKFSACCCHCVLSVVVAVGTVAIVIIAVVVLIVAAVAVFLSCYTRPSFLAPS